MSNQKAAVKSGIMTMYSSWDDVREGLAPGEVLHVEKGTLPIPEHAGLQDAPLSLAGVTADRVFCDNRDTHSLRVYEHRDHYAAKVVKHRPESGVTSALAHAITDVGQVTALAASVGFGLYQASQAADK